MAEWMERRLGDLGTVVGGGTPSRERAEYWRGPIRWLTPGELTGNNEKYVSETQDCITELGLASSGARLLPQGSLLVTSRASIGSCALAGVPMATNQGFKNLVPSAEVDPSYLFYLGRTLGREMTRRASGTTFLEISGREFGRITVRLPPVKEQRRIAEIFDTIDETIQTTERIVAKLTVVQIGVLRAALQAATPTSHQSTVQREFEIVTGITLNAGRVPRSNPVGYLRVANVHRGEIDISDLAMLEATEDEVKRKGLAVGDLLVVEGHANPREIGRCALVPKSADGLLFQNHLFRLRSRSMIPDVAELILNSAEARAYWLRMCATSSGLHTINSSMLRAMPIPVPDSDHQLLLSELCNASDAPISTELQRLAKLRKLRSGLAADLLSGRVRTVAA